VTNSYTIGADGVSIAVYDFGGDGPDLLLAHATGFHAHVLEPMIGHLLASFHCYAFDARGHGASGVPDNGDFDWHRSAGDVLAVLDHLGLERPYGFGHSAGGALVLLAEEQVPGTWRALYTYEPVIFHPGLLAPPSEAPTAATNPLAAGALRRRTDFPSRADAFANFAAKPPFSVLAPDALRAYVVRVRRPARRLGDAGLPPRERGGHVQQRPAARCLEPAGPGHLPGHRRRRRAQPPLLAGGQPGGGRSAG